MDAIERLQAIKTRRIEVTEEQLLMSLGEIAFSKPAGPPSVRDQHNALVALMRHKGMFPTKQNGAPLPAANVNVFNVTEDQVAKNVDRIFKRASEEQAKKRALN